MEVEESRIFQPIGGRKLLLPWITAFRSGKLREPPPQFGREELCAMALN